MNPLDKAIKVLDSTHNVVVLAHNDFDGIDMSDEFKRAINCINTSHSQSITFNKKNTYNINFICDDSMYEKVILSIEGTYSFKRFIRKD